MRTFRNITAEARWVVLGIPNPLRIEPGATVAVHELCAPAYEACPAHWQLADAADVPPAEGEKEQQS